MTPNNDAKALKSGIWYILSNFIVKGAVFLTTPFFTRLMPVEDIGSFSNISAWVHILTIITSLDLMASVTFAKFDFGEENFDKFNSSVLTLSTIVALGFYITVSIFHKFFENLLGVDLLSLHLIFIYCLVCPALQIIQVKNRVLYKYKLSTVLSILSVLLSTICSLVLVLLRQNKLTGRIVGYYGSLIIFNITLYFYIFIKGKSASPRYWRYALQISLPMVIHGLSGQLLNTSDRIMITKMIGSSPNAMYSIAYTTSMVISVLWTSLNTAWSPWAYDQMHQKRYDKLKRASKPYIIMFFSIVILFMLIAPELMLIMGGKKYLEAINCVPPIVVGMFFQFIYSIYVNIEFFNKKQKFTALGTTIAALLNIVLNWIFIPVFGYVAAAYTTLIGYMVLFLVHFFIVSRMGKLWWYDSRFNLTILVISLIFIPLLSIFYQNNAIRWCFIVAIIIFLIVFLIKRRKELLEAIKSRSIGNVLRVLSV